MNLNDDVYILKRIKKKRDQSNIIYFEKHKKKLILDDFYGKQNKFNPIQI